MEGNSKTNVGMYIPSVLFFGVLLVSYKFLGPDLIDTMVKRDLLDKYDYIIIGAGTSGSVMASRLSEDEKTQVLLLEAGGDPTNNEDIDIPINADAVRGSSFDWSYKTIPQKHACKSHVDGMSTWPSGKGIGGTSLLNYMQYLRGSRHDYDEWVHHGAQGWGYKDVLPYFIKSEDNRNSEYMLTVFHGQGGRMSVSDIELSPVTKIAGQALGEWGIKRKDINGKSQFGFAPTQATVKNGLRWSTKKAFYDRARHRYNLDTVTNAQVLKILFEGKKAVGVKYRVGDKEHTIRATKEIILSAGTVGSAKLLMLSGVGPRAHLQQLKIPVVADVPVGENLQDHVMADGVEFFTPHTISITAARSENFFSSWAYSLFGTGMKGSPRFREGTAYIKIRNQPPHIKYPLLALHFVANVNLYTAEKLNIKESSYEAIHGGGPHKDGFTVFPVLLHPRSKGNIRLKSANPNDDPFINPNYLAEDVDAKILIEGIKVARKLFSTQVMKDWEMVLNNNLLPECAKLGNFTDGYYECFLRHITLSGYAPVGSCKMGAAGDPTAVVDPNLRVRGVKNLRVVDASVIPASMSGNTYATQVMIAEKVSDIIREKNTVLPIQEYFKHLIAIKHDKLKEDEDTVAISGGAHKKK